MASTPELLKLSPLIALETLIQASLKTGFDIKYLTIGPPVGDASGITQVQLSLNKSKAPVDYWGLEGSIIYTYNRLDLTDFFEQLDTTFIVDFPVTVSQVLALIESRYAIAFASDEFIAQTIDMDQGDPFVLKAAPNSLRWVGEVALTLQQRIKPLTEVLPVTLLDEFTYSVVEDAALPLVRLVASLNKLNSKTLVRPITVEELEVGMPVQIGQNNDLDNTEVEVSITSETPYTGSIKLQYQRRYMPRMSNYHPIVVVNSEVSTLREVARLAADSLGMYLDLNDIVDGPLPELAPGEVRTLTLPLAPHSLMYFGDMTVDFSR